MIITRTPLRISLVGGGTDLPEFFTRSPGAVVSTAIDKYVYVALNPKFDGRFRISYSRTENVDTADEIQHELVRAVMKAFNLRGMEVTAIADVPGEGSGLGSSSAFVVGLVHAVLTHLEIKSTPKQLAEIAYMIERKVCHKPVGKQDHYAAAFGSFLYYGFSKNERVDVRGFNLLDEELDLIASQIMLFWTGITRQSSDILASMHFSGTGFDAGVLMAEVARDLRDCIMGGQVEKIGKCIKASWMLKKKFSDQISPAWSDALVDKALEAGADGAKICGAGGGGFLLVLAPPSKHPLIEQAVSLRRVPVKIGARGSTVIFQ